MQDRTGNDARTPNSQADTGRARAEGDLAQMIDEAAETARQLFTRERGAAEGIRAYIAFRAALVCVAAGEGDVDEVFAALHAAVQTRDLDKVEVTR